MAHFLQIHDMAEVNVDELIRKRGAIKQKLTKFANYLNKVDDSSTALIKAERLQIKRMLENAVPLLTEYDSVNDQISDDDDEGPSFEDTYYEVISRAKSLLQADENTPSTGEALKANEVTHATGVLPPFQTFGTHGTVLNKNSKSLSPLSNCLRFVYHSLTITHSTG